MNQIPNPDNWMDVFTILVATAMLAVPSWLGIRNHKGISEVKKQNEAIVGQVINGHEGKPALRADMDAIREEITGMRDEMRGGFAALRGDISEERLARRAGDEAIRDELHR